MLPKPSALAHTGYLLKYAAPKELLQAIDEVLKGASYLSPRITSGAVAAMLRSATVTPEEARELTPRQREVIQLFAEGRSMKEIADILTISLRTVAAHKYQIMDLLEIKTNAELYRYAVKHKTSPYKDPLNIPPRIVISTNIQKPICLVLF